MEYRQYIYLYTYTFRLKEIRFVIIDNKIVNRRSNLHKNTALTLSCSDLMHLATCFGQLF